MTSNRSTLKLLQRTTVFPCLIIAYLLIFSEAPVIYVGLISLYMAFHSWRDFRRRSTLRQREDGTYVWINWDGSEACAITDPSAPGGEWDGEDDGGDGGD